jgi:hypothetical protein
MNLVIWLLLRHLLAQSKLKLLDLSILKVEFLFKRLDFLF